MCRAGGMDGWGPPMVAFLPVEQVVKLEGVGVICVGMETSF
jgi:hypothetical protein